MDKLGLRTAPMAELILENRRVPHGGNLASRLASSNRSPTVVGLLDAENQWADMDPAVTKMYVSESFVKACLDAIQIRSGSASWPNWFK